MIYFTFTLQNWSFYGSILFVCCYTLLMYMIWLLLLVMASRFIHSLTILHSYTTPPSDVRRSDSVCCHWLHVGPSQWTISQRLKYNQDKTEFLCRKIWKNID